MSDVIAVSGALRFSKLSDFLPWRLLGNDPMGWCNDKTHPYFVNYLSMVTLAKVGGTLCPSCQPIPNPTQELVTDRPRLRCTSP